jgi:hypothetical protein
MGFFTNTGMSTPFKASAISCTLKGFGVVRAPIHSMSTPAFRQASTCWALATSVMVSSPVSFPASTSHSKAGSPRPSKVSGRVRGFQIPARRAFTWGACWRMPRAVSSICSRLSALHGPAISSGRSKPIPQSENGRVGSFAGCGMGPKVPLKERPGRVLRFAA